MNDVCILIVRLAPRGAWRILMQVNRAFRDAVLCLTKGDVPSTTYFYARCSPSLMTYMRIDYCSPADLFTAAIMYRDPQYLQELLSRRGDSAPLDVYNTVASHGTLNHLKVCISHFGRRPRVSVYADAIRTENTNVFVFLVRTYPIRYPKNRARLVCAAALVGRPDYLKRLLRFHDITTVEAMDNAIYSGSLECTKIVCAHLDPRVLSVYDFCAAAARHGHVNILHYFHHGCGLALTGNVTILAAGFGHLEALKYAHEAGCEWSHLECMVAASGGHAHCLEFAHTHGSRCHANVLTAARSQGNADCIEYCEKVCP